MNTYRIEAASVAEPEDRDWSEVRTELPLDRAQAFDLCRTLASTPGAQPHFRVVRVSDGVYLLRLSDMTRLA